MDQVEANREQMNQMYEEIKKRNLGRCKEYCLCPHCMEIVKGNQPLWEKLEDFKKENHDLLLKIDGNLSLYTRGIGMDWVPCFICGKVGEKNGVNHNIAAFVRNKEEGDIMRLWFTTAWHDYRPSEPNCDQLKIGACNDHLVNLEILNNLIGENNIINQKMIQQSIKPSPKDYAGRISSILHRITKTILNWLESDYCAYHIPVSDTLDGDEKQLCIRIKMFKEMTPIEHISMPKLFERIFVDNTAPFAKICEDLDWLADRFPSDFEKDTCLQFIQKTTKMLFHEIFARKLNDGADRERWQELDCGCGYKEFTMKCSSEGISDVVCKNCGTKFWHHGSWKKSIPNGWEIVWDCRSRARGEN